eukprot:GHRR01015775.1.p4 GENE.GHRR01015775.1~~GHRR01015775.1.p4  ORF type:complete len:131 (-),score=23.84 GHRR01015775.1:921-1313(-)
MWQTSSVSRFTAGTCITHLLASANQELLSPSKMSAHCAWLGILFKLTQHEGCVVATDVKSPLTQRPYPEYRQCKSGCDYYCCPSGRYTPAMGGWHFLPRGQAASGYQGLPSDSWHVTQMPIMSQLRPQQV